MIGPINTFTSTHSASTSIGKKSQQETEYKQPKVTESQNYQNQLIEISDDMSMVATLFSQRFGQRLEKKANRGKNTLYIAEEGADKKLDKVMMLFRKSGRSLQELLQYLRKMFPDESDLVMVLRELLRKKKLGAQLDAGIENEINNLLEGENGKQIRAGINIALQAKAFAKLLSLDASTLRNLYRSYINLDLEPIYFFQMWIEEYDLKQCTIILNFLTQSLICDMQSLMPSCSKSSEFGYLLERVNKLRTLYSFIEMNVKTLEKKDLKNTITEKDLYQLIFYGMTFPDEMEKYLISLLENEWLNYLTNIKMKLLQGLKTMFNEYPESLYLSYDFRDECQIIMQKFIDNYLRLEQYQQRK
ncbi:MULTISPECIES: type III secretion system gatekeeper subunit SctW [Proteus]|uniref:Type III secretion system gatekeeper subunit SctW n=5 Tax=Gammaproteobacteria TaxID=1236 RepID=A0A6G6T035_9GAMM|nr:MULTISPECIES: type III secretion system gatekeeper subunit SctW [Proteus]MBG2915645.1 type III secretion system gatekeeper subunit SctW [Proteus terrae subsp. cibarius]MBG3091702.1 type III secretion system gatekeeper subunit SctW [Proteus terrae subsp. cibarius]MCM2368163.1 type III secretion system gatekeeper subunit SctW [Proteus sp. FZP2095]MCO4182594.1 type III secretion system gatekeeper subunit SctW [Proteus terrae]MCO4190902.1 type III secretion system gatekeeper subunit SctW [Prote